jgi:hypothetical protein
VMMKMMMTTVRSTWVSAFMIRRIFMAFTFQWSFRFDHHYLSILSIIQVFSWNKIIVLILLLLGSLYSGGVGGRVSVRIVKWMWYVLGVRLKRKKNEDFYKYQLTLWDEFFYQEPVNFFQYDKFTIKKIFILLFYKDIFIYLIQQNNLWFEWWR